MPRAGQGSGARGPGGASQAGGQHPGQLGEPREESIQTDLVLILVNKYIVLFSQDRLDGETFLELLKLLDDY